MEIKETVCAVVVTYNRKNLLIECLEALKKQTRPLEGIYLIDNASTDETPKLLLGKGYIKELPPDNLSEPWEKEFEINNLINEKKIKIHYVRMHENTGGAGGFYEGVKRGYEKGYDWLWLMDDDAEPMPDSLEKMSPGFSINRVFAVANLPIDVDGAVQFNHRGWVDLCRTDGEVAKHISDNQLTNDIIDIGQASFVGLAINKVVIDKIGYPKKEFFIHHDDFYYCYKILKIGKIILMRQSLIKHKEATKQDTKNLSFLGRSSARSPLDKLWLRYYGLRNLVWMRKQHCPKTVLFFFIFKYYLRMSLAVILYDDHKILRMKFYLNAILDGLFGRFDNQKPRNITRIGVK